eukprot:1178936-Rhodomonas_salina.2
MFQPRATDTRDGTPGTCHTASHVTGIHAGCRPTHRRTTAESGYCTPSQRVLASSSPSLDWRGPRHGRAGA